jgi:CubicO group peptidase (beta-lactamase class C family)
MMATAAGSLIQLGAFDGNVLYNSRSTEPKHLHFDKEVHMIQSRILQVASLMVTVSFLIEAGMAQTDRYTYSAPVRAKDGLKTGTLKDAGLDEQVIATGTGKIISGGFGNVHSLLIVRDGKLVHEAYFKGEDFQRGKGKLGVVQHGQDTLHDMRSVSKTFVGAAVLAAHSKGKIKSLDASIFDYLPDHKVLAEGQKKEITIRHLLTMAAGLDWNEQMSYMDPANDETRMDAAPDAIAFFLSKPEKQKPGSTFNYTGGATETLAAIIKNATGKSADTFIADEFFKPLGITSFEWAKRSNGSVIYPSGLRLRSRDLAKFGMLYLNRGLWDKKQIIRPELIDEAVKVQIVTPFPIPNGGSVGYGYHIWRPTIPVGPNELMTMTMAEGNGGQMMVLDFERNAVTVMTAGSYNSRERSTDAVYEQVIYPVLKRAQKVGRGN